MGGKASPRSGRAAIQRPGEIIHEVGAARMGDKAGNSVKAQKSIEAISNALGGNPYAITPAIPKKK